MDTDTVGRFVEIDGGISHFHLVVGCSTGFQFSRRSDYDHTLKQTFHFISCMFVVVVLAVDPFDPFLCRNVADAPAVATL